MKNLLDNRNNSPNFATRIFFSGKISANGFKKIFARNGKKYSHKYISAHCTDISVLFPNDAAWTDITGGAVAMAAHQIYDHIPNRYYTSKGLLLYIYRPEGTVDKFIVTDWGIKLTPA